MELIVRGAPQQYLSEVNSWHRLPNYLSEHSVTKVLIVYGIKSMKVAENFLPDLSSFQLNYYLYEGKCTRTKAMSLATKIKEMQIETVIGIGGGALSDLVKLATNISETRLVILPTLASTCAAYSAVSVLYNEEGVYEEMAMLDKATDLVLVNPEVILDSPKEMLVAGIGDTLAKWYEAEPVISSLDTLNVSLQVSLMVARKCRDNLLTYSTEAILSHENNELNQAFITIVETTIMLAGLVGGFGDHYARTSGAHSIHDALTLVPESHQHLHGKKVAYGILVQLALEEKFKEIEQLRPFYTELNLPMTLHEMGISTECVEKVATRATREDEYIHLLPQKVTKELVCEAMIRLEQLS